MAITPQCHNATTPIHMLKKRRRNFRNEVNAGSMADIAFLLLIFFLVTTTIDIDKGIFVKLPFWQEDIPITDMKSNNVFTIKVNRANELLVEGELGQIQGLRNKVKEFIMNPADNPQLASAPNKAVVALQNDRGTSYQTYIGVYNEVKAAYSELWEAEAEKRYGMAFVDLPLMYRRDIKRKIPSVISESEPTEH